MKIYIALIAYLLILNNASSQMIATPSNNVILSPKTDFIKVAKGFMGIRTDVKYKGGYHTPYYSVSVVMYDHKMKELKEQKLSEGAFIYGELTPRLIQTGNKLWVIYGAQKKHSIGDLYATEINTETALPGITKTISTESEISKNNVHRVLVRSSPDNTQHCIAILDEARPIYLVALNEEMTPVWKQKFTLPKLHNYDVRDVAILNSGEVFISEVSEKGDAKMFRYSPTGVMTSQEMTFPEGIPQFISFLSAKNGITYVGGTLRKNSKNITTVYLAQLGDNFKLNEMKQLEIPAFVLDPLDKDGLAKSSGKNPGIDIKVFPQLFEQKDGRIKMIIEGKRYLGTQSYTGAGGLVIVDFMAVANNFSIIPRYMFVSWTLERHQVQYIAEPRDNDIVLFYFDHRDNLSKPLTEPQKPLAGSNNAVLVAATVKNNSPISRTEIVVNKGKTYSEIIQEYLVK